MSIDAVVLAAGRGTRFGGDAPKQYLPLDGSTVLARALDAFLAHAAIRRVVAVIGAGDEGAFRAAVGPRADRVEVVTGGDTRQASVAAALAHLAVDPPERVLVHDGARPFLSAALIDRVARALDDADAVIPAVPVADTLKRIDHGRVAGTVPRDGLAQAQTPQGFRFAALRAAHAAMPGGATDDAMVMEAAGHPVRVVEGERTNHKITTPDDLPAARLTYPAVGKGFDVHRLTPGGPLILGGLTLDAPFHLAGHSDADVALHAITDALFGAIGDGDIGHHFPPSDPAWKGAASDQFLAFAADRVRAAGEICHVDLTIICERPKIGPVREAMRRRIAEIVGIAVERVSVKATTTERLGFTGRGEGIAAEAVATILRS
ncbi:bifunctional 2-C-methyl-D-erythritol 4-phosphate cytidylyltransferase/2-C-methyl-D-erythritol 2,4-cyclodiphosphate synthase [Acuticoccus mangrovi]|uniref:Bifunctional enzyme IspD/IspF n=1 Tax=Acuticoccus mangrovi TaxID=2796142 RepID=A0A934MEJ8_9HYPH|nr:bifunctional 2-C-methyl-D-erythritol 4-phosphate cytidylyltransferase/2-C-methyl-D-erythritol 2,4-cyclodiphosphate synthase [Acuticoccus mangrovi]MBJ3774448.1 bifunctional 2-C-methyl-D-erythritol 4-phosphate cytidylyltransferase/2-C-methyl-D-erythritol 2,4-cyclodiphosphate synthase [Acuticoccus mangrovi]